MRVKREMSLGIKRRARSNLIALLIAMPVIVILIGYFLAIYVVAPILNSGTDDKESFQYAYDISALDYYVITFSKDKLEVAKFNKIYQKEYNGQLCGGVFLSKDDAAKVMDKLSKSGIKANLYNWKQNKISLSYLGEDKGNIKIIQGLVDDFQSLLKNQSNMYFKYYMGLIDNNSMIKQLNDIQSGYQRLSEQINLVKYQENKFKIFKQSVSIIADLNLNAINGAQFSLNLNDGNAYKILQDAFIESSNLYKKMIIDIKK